MTKHPIESLMSVTMENIHNMIDVNTIVGQPVETKAGSVIIPVSKVNCGFATGGGNNISENKTEDNKDNFSGGSGAGVMLHPTAFLIVEKGQIRLLPLDNNAALDRLINLAPELLEKIKEFTTDKKVNSGSVKQEEVYN